MLDFEVNREIDQLAQGVDVSDEALALELIEQNGPSANHTYLGSEHTARSFRAAQWLPPAFRPHLLGIPRGRTGEGGCDPAQS